MKTATSVQLDDTSETSVDTNTNFPKTGISSEVITLHWSSRIPLSPIAEYYCKSSIDVAVENCLNHLDAFTLLLAVRKTMKSSKWDIYFVTTMMQQALFNGEYISRAVMVLYALVGSGCSQSGNSKCIRIAERRAIRLAVGSVFVIEAIASHRNIRLSKTFLDLLFPVPVAGNEDDGFSKTLTQQRSQRSHTQMQASPPTQLPMPLLTLIAMFGQESSETLEWRLQGQSTASWLLWRD